MTAWGLDPVVPVLGLGLCVAYVLGVRRVLDRCGSWPVLRSVAFVIGVLAAVAVADGPVGSAAHRSFSAFTTQVVVLLVVAPVPLAFGRPLTLAVAALPDRAAARIRAALDGRLLRTFGSPMVGPLLVPVALAAVFFTPVLQASLTHLVAYEVLHLVLLALGFLFALPLAGERGEEGALALAVGLFVGFAELLLDALPGIVVRLDTHLLAAPFYLRTATAAAALRDQQLGGAILWGLGESLDIPFLAILLVRWMHADAREAARVDRALDAQAAVAASAVAAVDPGASAVAGVDSASGADGASREARTVPWWELESGVFSGPRAREFRRAAQRSPRPEEHPNT